MEKLVSRCAHNAEVVGSIPTPATKAKPIKGRVMSRETLAELDNIRYKAPELEPIEQEKDEGLTSCNLITRDVFVTYSPGNFVSRGIRVHIGEGQLRLDVVRAKILCQIIAEILEEHGIPKDKEAEDLIREGMYRNLPNKEMVEEKLKWVENWKQMGEFWKKAKFDVIYIGGEENEHPGTAENG